ncbi:MAG TPA: energy transducer TonB [Patescibacteria group bacterium]|nr:energy transducer TonB [Patescibacteria group bacterium]
MIVATLALGMATFLAAAPPPAKQAAPLRISSVVMQTKLVESTPVKYPEAARKKNIQGDVNLDVVIGRNGSVKSVKVTDGPKQLTKAAVSAVKHWRYQPTVVNGKQVEVETAVDVEFKLTPPPAAKPAQGSEKH